MAGRVMVGDFYHNASTAKLGLGLGLSSANMFGVIRIYELRYMAMFITSVFGLLHIGTEPIIIGC